MDNSTYILTASQVNDMRNLKLIANNSANVSTAGFKEDVAIFKSYIVKDVDDALAFSVPDREYVNFAEAAIKTTGNAFDLAVNGPGFFIVRTDDGPIYTRNGSFKLNKEGVLCNANGYPVLSFDGQEIIFEDADASPLIGEDGIIYVGTQERGRVGVVEFDDLKALRKIGGNLFASSQEGKVAENSRVMQGSIETSNVNGVANLTRLSELQVEVSAKAHLIEDAFALQRSAFKTYAKNGG